MDDVVEEEKQSQLIFEITSNDGFCVRAHSCDGKAVSIVQLWHIYWRLCDWGISVGYPKGIALCQLKTYLFSYSYGITVPDLKRQMFNNCYKGPSLPGAGHISLSVRVGDMDLTGRWPEDSGSLSYEMPATDFRYPLDRPHQQRDCLITY